MLPHKQGGNNVLEESQYPKEIMTMLQNNIKKLVFINQLYY